MHNNKDEEGSPERDWDDIYGTPDNSFAEFDRFVKSDLYRGICTDADEGDPDSLEIMEKISDMLGNVCWHLENKSDDTRIKYEIKCMNDFVKSWGEFE